MENQLLTWIVYFLLGFTALALGLVAHLIFWSWYYRRREISGTLSWIHSSDGWRIALEQVPAHQGVPNKGQILCCPGLACNGRIFHFRDDLSFAQNMSDEGWTVWILHPRGTGPSERPWGADERIYGYEQYVKDGIAATEFVRKQAQGPLLWVGHSLGGLIGLEVARKYPHYFDGMITMGTPIALNRHTINPFYFGVFKWFCRGFKTAYLGKLSTFVSPWAGWLPFLHPAPLYVNFELIAKADLRTALVQCFEDTPRQILDEFVNAVQSSTGPWEHFKKDLPNLNLPLLAFAGDRDGLAPLTVTRAISELGQSEYIDWFVLEGFSHLELALSDGVKPIVMPKIHAWLSKHEFNHASGYAPTTSDQKNLTSTREAED